MNTYSVPGIVLFVCKRKANFSNPYLQIIQSRKEKKCIMWGNTIKTVKALYHRCKSSAVLHDSQIPSMNFVKFKEGSHVCKYKKGPCNWSLEFLFFFLIYKAFWRALMTLKISYFTCAHLTYKGHMFNMAESRRAP